MVYSCSWGQCHSSSVKTEPGVTFVRFPRLRKQKRRLSRWVFLCGRKGFKCKDVTKDSYICSKHFPPNVVLNPRKNMTLRPFDALKPSRFGLTPNTRNTLNSSNLVPQNMSNGQKPVSCDQMPMSNDQNPDVHEVRSASDPNKHELKFISLMENAEIVSTLEWDLNQEQETIEALVDTEKTNVQKFYLLENQKNINHSTPCISEVFNAYEGHFEEKTYQEDDNINQKEDDDKYYQENEVHIENEDQLEDEVLLRDVPSKVTQKLDINDQMQTHEIESKHGLPDGGCLERNNGRLLEWDLTPPLSLDQMSCSSNPNKFSQNVSVQELENLNVDLRFDDELMQADSLPLTNTGEYSMELSHPISCVPLIKEESRFVNQGVQVQVSESKAMKALQCEVILLRRTLNFKDSPQYPQPKANAEWNLLTGSDATFLSFTGFNQRQFKSLFLFLSPEISEMTYWRSGVSSEVRRRIMSEEMQLVMTLVRLRQNYPLWELALRWGISKRVIGEIFVTMIQLMYHKFGLTRSKMFALRENLTQPLSFRNKLLRNCRVVIDCTEFHCESNSNYEAQGNMYSHYKHHTTIKVLIGVSPTGALLFCSEAFEGSISDKSIAAKSGFLDYINEGDVVMAERGFTIWNELAEKKASLLIPPFTKSGGKLSASELYKTKVIAKARIHVERFNERLKNYKILQGVIPANLFPLTTQMIFVCSNLVNFGPPLCAK